MNRRELTRAAAGAALLAANGRLGAQAAQYDLVIRGGRVIDPSLRLDAVRDVGIVAGPHRRRRARNRRPRGGD